MKNYLLLASLVLSAAGSAFAQPASSENSSLATLLEGGSSVARGMSREAVTLMLGTPDTSLAPGVWVYWNFGARGLPASSKLDTLVVMFDGDRVANLRLCHADVVRSAVAKVKAKSAPAPKAIAAK